MFESIYFSILIAGFGGGVVRGLVGFIKHQYSYKSVSFKLPYFLVMMFLSGIIGMLASSLIRANAVFALVAGYAGGDFIENIYKTIAKKPSLWEDLLR